MAILQALLRNAGSEHGRRQPALLIDDIELQAKSDTNQPRGAAATFLGGQATRPSGVADASHTDSHAFVSIPMDTSGRVQEHISYLQSPVAPVANRYANAYPSAADPFALDLASSGGDIFEELSMLDGGESGRDPHFMQNLGFAPDQDLADFFGADYQPSGSQLASLFASDAAGD